MCYTPSACQGVHGLHLVLDKVRRTHALYERKVDMLAKALDGMAPYLFQSEVYFDRT